jgi:hypothetical protein
MTWPPRWEPGPHFKQPKGTATIKKEKAAKDESALELLVKKDVRTRDKKCRCPLKHKCRGGLEVIHIKDRSLGGEFVSGNLWLGCGWIHNKGPVSIHSKEIEFRPLTALGANGPGDWFLKVWSESKPGEFTWKLIARESAPGVIEQ